MSLLNSILSSINDGQPPPRTTASTPKPATNAPVKRKAEDVGRNVMTKAPRVDTATTASASVSRSTTNLAASVPRSITNLPTSTPRSTTNSPAPRQTAALPAKPPVPYRGTAKSSTASSDASKPKAGTASAPTKPSVAPKTGYLAVLERAKAAQEATKQSGQIKHKPAEKLTKKERLRMQAEAVAAQKGKGSASKGPARSKSADPAPAKGGPVKKERKPTDLGYKGTMRPAPAPLSYTGTMRPSGSTLPRKPKPGPSSERYRYASYTDEEEDVDEEEDYESESDMEAGLDDVDREEEEALRAARLEDAAALKEENELKRAKLEKKRKLDLLAANAKKQRY